MNAPALPTPDFSRFPRYAELTALLQAYAAARPDVVQGMELDVIASVILGGCSLFGGGHGPIGSGRGWSEYHAAFHCRHRF